METRNKRKCSSIWEHFTVANTKEKLACCKICNGLLSYKSTVTNLGKHLLRRHNENNGTTSESRLQTEQRHPPPEPSLKKICKLLSSSVSTFERDLERDQESCNNITANVQTCPTTSQSRPNYVVAQVQGTWVKVEPVEHMEEEEDIIVTGEETIQTENQSAQTKSKAINEASSPGGTSATAISNPSSLPNVSASAENSNESFLLQVPVTETPDLAGPSTSRQNPSPIPDISSENLRKSVSQEISAAKSTKSCIAVERNASPITAVSSKTARNSCKSVSKRKYVKTQAIKNTDTATKPELTSVEQFIFHDFGKSVGVYLTKLPLDRAIITKEKIHSLISEEFLYAIRSAAESSSHVPSSSYSSPNGNIHIKPKLSAQSWRTSERPADSRDETSLGERIATF